MQVGAQTSSDRLAQKSHIDPKHPGRHTVVPLGLKNP
jgi:hypothetical protein